MYGVSCTSLLYLTARKTTFDVFVFARARIVRVSHCNVAQNLEPCRKRDPTDGYRVVGTCADRHIELEISGITGMFSRTECNI